jgi:predicted dienelactone hydrolase
MKAFLTSYKLVCTFFFLLSPTLSPLTGTLFAADKDPNRFNGQGGPYLHRNINDVVLTDPTRQREIPLKIYYPQNPPGPAPILLISHGMGGSRTSSNWMGRYLASHGYICIFLTHFGSDKSLFDFSEGIQENMEKFFLSFWGMKDNLDRPQDIILVLDSLKKIENSRQVLTGKMDLKKIGIAGHSFGAFTVLSLAGGYTEASRLLYGRSYEDPRPLAFLALSPPGTPPGVGPQLFYSKIKRPTMIMTGSRDEDPGARRPNTAESRLDAYHYMPPGDKYAVWIEGAFHHTFGDPKAGQTIDPLARKITLMAMLAFFDAYLKEDPTAKGFLLSDRIERSGEGKVKFYQK